MGRPCHAMRAIEHSQQRFHLQLGPAQRPAEISAELVPSWCLRGAWWSAKRSSAALPVPTRSLPGLRPLDVPRIVAASARRRRPRAKGKGKGKGTRPPRWAAVRSSRRTSRSCLVRGAAQNSLRWQLHAQRTQTQTQRRLGRQTPGTWRFRCSERQCSAALARGPRRHPSLVSG